MARHKSSARCGFTLVELLVVIGIIAVLIGILLPSLNKARARAQVVSCASLLRQVGVATANYAVENRDALPAMNQDLGQPWIDYSRAGSSGQPAGSDPWISFERSVQYPYWRNASIPANYVETEGSSIGRLICKNYMKGDFSKLTSCPNGNSQDLTRAAEYTYNVHMAYRTTPAGGIVMQPWWKKRAKYGRYKGELNGRAINDGSAQTLTLAGRVMALATDPLMTSSAAGTAGSPLGAATHLIGKERAYNLLAADGSVVTANMPNTIQRQQVINPSRFFDVLGWIEFAADGGDVKGAGTAFGTSNKFVVLPLDPR